MERSENSGSQDSGGRSRVHFILAIESVSDLYSELAPRMSTDGLYIETDQPVPPESEIGFTVTLPDGVVVIRGLGRVMWVRPPEAEGDPTGLAVRFSDLNPEARETLDAVIDAHLANGGVLFDLDGGQLGGDTFPTDILDTTSAVSHGPRWLREGEGRVATASVPGDMDTETGGEVEVRELQFEEAIAGFPGGPGLDAATDDRSLDDAIAAAVGLTTDGNHRNGVAPEAEVDTASSAASDDVIPDVLDRWRRELEIAGQGPQPSAPAAEPEAATREWESLLPFESAENSELDAPAPWSAPDRTTTSARWENDRNRRPGFWWMIALVCTAVVVVAVAFSLWLRGTPETHTSPAPQVAEIEEVAVAPLDDPADVAADQEIPSDAATEPAPAPPAQTASTVESVNWRAENGRTRVLIRADGVLHDGTVDAIRLDEPPRVLVRIRDITQPFAPHRFEVASSEVSAIRVGYHPELRPAALYVVLDLTSDDVLSDGALSVSGNQAVVTVRSGS